MKQAAELPWTDGAGKVLSKLAAVIHKQEMARADRDGDTFSDPMLMVQDLTTGTTILLQTESHEGGKTDGHGYRRCSDVRQRIPHKVPPGLQVGILLDMLVRMIVPSDAPADQVGPLAQAAYERIADAMLEAQEQAISSDKELAAHWKEKYAKHKEAVGSVVQAIKDMTWSTRAGDTLCKVEAVPIGMATLDVSVLEELEVTA